MLSNLEPPPQKKKKKPTKQNINLYHFEPKRELTLDSVNAFPALKVSAIQPFWISAVDMLIDCLKIYKRPLVLSCFELNIVKETHMCIKHD